MLTPSCLLCCRDISHSMLALSVLGSPVDTPIFLAVAGAPTSEFILVSFRVSTSSDDEEAS